MARDLCGKSAGLEAFWVLFEYTNKIKDTKIPKRNITICLLQMNLMREKS